MRRQRSAHYEDQTRLQRTITRNQTRNSQLTARAARLEALVARLVDTRGDRFAITVEDTRYRERAPAGTHLLSIVEQAMRTARNHCRVDRDIAQLGGISWRTQCHPSAPNLVEVDIAGTPIQISIEQADLRKIDPVRLIQRLENGAGKLPDALADTHHELDTLAAETTAAQQRLTSGFPAQQKLNTVEAELAVLNAELIADGHNDQRRPDGRRIAAAPDPDRACPARSVSPAFRGL